jgi:biotin transport system substrate-specific component
VSSSPMSAQPARRVLVDLLPGAIARDVVVVSAYVLAIVASTYVRFPVPGSPIPVTAQTFVVLLGAAALGTTRATVGASLFVGIGLAGVPWFAVTGGSSSGYLLGFVVAAGIVGAVARRRGLDTFPRAVLAMGAADVVILGLGMLGLMLWGASAAEAFALGVVPFLVGEVVKITLAAGLLPRTQRLLDRGGAAGG